MSAPRLISADEESQAFWRLRRHLLGNQFRQALARNRLRAVIVALLTAIFWGSVYALFLGGFVFLDQTIGHAATREQVVAKVFEIFFLSLLVMLVFSAGVILYGSLYRSRETAFLLTMPARAERVFIHKFQEAMLFASWGSILLATPMLAAYGVFAGAPWYYFLLLLPALMAFVYIPGAAGALCCLLVVQLLPRRRLHALILAGALAGGALAWIGWSLASGPQGDVLTPGWFQELFGRLSFSDYRLLPSWWLTAGLLAAAAGEWSQGALFLAVIVSNALVGHQVVCWAAARWYRGSYSGLFDKQLTRRGARGHWLDAWLMWGARPLPWRLRLLLVKDWRLFRRDPVQWSQFLIFFGLLGLYFLNVRRLSYDASSATWVNMISFLNLAVVGLILSTFTTRFIFPMVSLEGRRFWILGLLPIDRDAILWSKFVFALLGSLLTCVGLILVSDTMLRVPPLVIGMHLLTCLVLCTGLSGIAVGLGAKLPNLREESPSKIAAGFGGTLNLVLSTVYILAVILLTAVPCHFYVGLQEAGIPGLLWEPATIRWWLAGGAVGSLLLGAAATIWPLRIGLRAFRELEF